MTTSQDCSIGIGAEVTFKTGVTPTRWFEFEDESIDWDKSVKQSTALRVGSRVARAARRAVVTGQGKGDVVVPAISKGMGLLWESCLGSMVSTLVSGTTYQQVGTFADVLPSRTVQKGIVEVGGTVDPYTYTGCTVDSWELDFPNADYVKLKTSWDCADVTTATAYAAPSYPAAANLFHFAGGSVYSGTLTAPTSSALASAATALADVRGGSISCKNSIAGNRFNLGGAGRKSRQVVQGLREITGKVDVEYDNTTFRDAVIADTGMALVLTWTAAALSTGLETLQVVLPEVRFNGELPKAKDGDLVMQSLSFDVLDNLSAAQPLWVVMRTSDAAI